MKKNIFIITLLCVSALTFYIYLKASPLCLEKDISLPFQLGEKERNILYYASLAPNAHNAQAWNVRYYKESNTFILAFDTARALQATDPDNRETYLSLGAFLENFRQAALAYGFDTKIDILSEASTTVEKAEKAEKVDIARIHLLPQKNPPSLQAVARLELMKIRHTDKRPYSNKPINQRKLSELLQKHQAFLSYYAKGTAEFDYLSKIAINAMQMQGEQPEKRAELATWLRFSDEEAKAHRDGLPAEQLSISGLRKFFYYSLYDREKARSASFGQEAVDQVKDQVSHSAGFFIITGKNSSLPELIKTGMAFEAFWLDAAAFGILLQPMSQMLEEAPYMHEITRKLKLSRPVQMVFRAGTLPNYGQNARVRRNIADFVIELKNAPLSSGK